MPNISCRDVRPIVQCYVDEECTLAMMLAVAQHLERCAACRHDVSQLRWLKAAVRRCGPELHAPESRLWH